MPSLDEIRKNLQAGKVNPAPAPAASQPLAPGRSAAVPEFLRALAGSLGSIVGDPAHAPKGAAIVNALNRGASLIERGEAGVSALTALARELRALTAGHEASGAEWTQFKEKLSGAAASSPSRPSASSLAAGTPLRK
jgi:hypothetical protein